MSALTRSPTLPIQEAIYDRASADDELKALDAEIYDYVPEDAPRPYVVIGEAFTTPDNTHGEIGWVTISTLSIWSDDRGFRQAHLVKDRIVQLFDHQPLTVEGFHHVETRFEFDQMLRDPQPTLRRALLRLRTATEQE
ncbi:MAG: DUF3168 domain-containing protein [Vicinamibacterales bacterium]